MPIQFLKIVLIVFFLYSFEGYTQPSNGIVKELQKADSLCFSGQFERSLVLIDNLDKGLDPNIEDYKFIKLKLLQKKSYCLLLNHARDSAAKNCLYIIDNGSIEKYPEDIIMANIWLALIHDLQKDPPACRVRLDIAEQLLNTSPIDSLWSIFHIRKSSYYRSVDSTDLAIKHAQIGLKNAKKFNDILNLADGNLLLGIIHGNIPKLERINFYKKSIKYNLQMQRVHMASNMYDNISQLYLEMDSIELALKFNDTALVIGMNTDRNIKKTCSVRYMIYKQLKQYDSALVYLEKVNEYTNIKNEKDKSTEIKKITEQYENKKKAEIISSQKIKTKRQGIIIITSIVFLSILIAVLTLLYRVNRKLKTSKTKIETQASELERSLEQKELLLAEIHHRVKNNLQTIIGMLEFQNSFAQDKTIAQITLETQNRVQSLAILHDKVYVKDGGHLIDFNPFLKDIINLFVKSHSFSEREVIFKVDADSVSLNVDQSIPLGLILVELITNSYKYAFNEMKEGLISISISRQTNHFSYLLQYKDNGVGIKNDKKENKGMGYQIITGLVNQLKGEISHSDKNGIDIKIHF